MVKAGTVIVGGTILGGVAALVYFGLRRAAKPPEAKRYVLTIEVTVGGTTFPSPGVYAGDEPAIVRVTATPSEGYLFDGWYISGEKVSSELIYDVNVSNHVLLIASFIGEGAPPLIPSYIRPVQNAVAEEYWKVWTELEAVTDHFHIGPDYLASGYVRFRICDSAGNGVPGQNIAVYSDPNPDALGFGCVLLNDKVRTRVNPLILTSNAAGEVSAKVDYRWVEPVSLIDGIALADVNADGVVNQDDLDLIQGVLALANRIGMAEALALFPRCDIPPKDGLIDVYDIGYVALRIDKSVPRANYEKTVGTSGKLQYKCVLTYTWVSPVKDGFYINRPCNYVRWERIKTPILRNINYIHAYWVDNPNLPSWGDASVDCMIRIEDSKILGPG